MAIVNASTREPSTARAAVCLFCVPVVSIVGEMLPATFRNYSGYLKERYGQTVYRVAVDAGFSCPNRGLKPRQSACTYCDGSGSRAPYLGDEKDIKRQVEAAIAFLRQRYQAESYILYFQAFTNTFASTQQLKRIYDFALSLAPFRELVVSTRPDCIDQERALLLKSYTERGIDVWVELGLQSAHDATLRRIERGHTVSAFSETCRLLHSMQLKVAAHLIFGLPSERMWHVLRTARYLAALGIDGVKIHNLHIPWDTALFQEYLKGEITCPCPRRHLHYVIRTLELLPKRTVVMRLTCDTPPERLALPTTFWEKGKLYAILTSEMARRKTWQGKLCTFEMGD